MAKYVKIGNSIRDINRSLKQSQENLTKTKTTSSYINMSMKHEKPSVAKTKSFLIEKSGENWWSQAKLALGEAYIDQRSWNKVIPVKLDVVSQRRIPDEPDPPPQEYAVASQVPYDHGDKFNLHRVDRSYYFNTDSSRPINLKVVIPVKNTSKRTKLNETYAMEKYPNLISMDVKYLGENKHKHKYTF